MGPVEHADDLRRLVADDGVGSRVPEQRYRDPSGHPGSRARVELVQVLRAHHRVGRHARTVCKRPAVFEHAPMHRSEEHTSELQSLMRISYAVFCLKKTKTYKKTPL